jgi:RND superfamily putative drug exporter
MAEVGGFERTDNRVTLGELLAERLQLTLPWYRSWIVRRRTLRLIERLRLVVAGSSFNEQSQPQQLPQFERGIALSLVALAERTPVVMLDQIDPFASADDERAFVTAVCALAEPGTTIVIGTPEALRSDAAACAGGRTVVDLDLDSLSLSTDREVLR